jgi:hypothetical protein
MYHSLVPVQLYLFSPHVDSLSPHVGWELGRPQCAGSVVLLVHNQPSVSYVFVKKEKSKTAQESMQ